MYYLFMKVSNISFGAKKPIIRRLDDINRGFIQQYSFVKSPTKLLTHVERRGESILDVKNEKYCYLANLWDCRIILLREEEFESIAKLQESVRKNKAGNCQELCEILQEELSKKGYQARQAVFDVQTDNEKRKMKDHMFLIINSKNDIQEDVLQKSNTIVLDPFFGFVDYAPNALRRFSNELGLKEGEQLKFKVLDK